MPARVKMIVGLSFGDEGKGSCVDFLTRRHRARLVVRFNGGAQAGHNVVTDDGHHHTFAQFGAGTLAGAETFLSRYMLVNPIFMFAEAAHLAELGVSDPLSLVRADKRALVTTPYHVALNRLKELARGSARHGSCGMGIGETVEHALSYPDEAVRVGDLRSISVLHEKLRALQQRAQRVVRDLSLRDSSDENQELYVLTDESTLYRTADFFETWASRVRCVGPAWLDPVLAADDMTVIFEGAQGVLLDQDHGFHPHTTWSDCTFGNAERLLNEAYFTGVRERIGVVRTYATRHGVGPFPTEVPGLAFDGEHNSLGPWQGTFRSGWLDLPLLRYATEACGGVDSVAVTCLDRLHNLNANICTGYLDRVPAATRWPVLETQARAGQYLEQARPFYRQLGTDPVNEVVVAIEHATDSRCKIRSFGPKASDKHLTGEDHASPT